MAKILSSVNLAVLSGGTVTWEKCTLGVPSLVTIQSNNQVKNSYALEKKGAHIVIGKSERVTSKNYTNKIQALSPKKINSMSRISSKICDGKGIARVVKKLLS